MVASFFPPFFRSPKNLPFCTRQKSRKQPSSPPFCLLVSYFILLFFPHFFHSRTKHQPGRECTRQHSTSDPYMCSSNSSNSNAPNNGHVFCVNCRLPFPKRTDIATPTQCMFLSLERLVYRFSLSFLPSLRFLLLSWFSCFPLVFWGGCASVPSLTSSFSLFSLVLSSHSHTLTPKRSLTLTLSLSSSHS